jgi:hypothetical protein
MFRIATSALTIALALGTLAAAGGPRGETIGHTDPRARPFVYVLLAAADDDPELFKFAFSQDVKARVKDGEWAEGLAAYRKQLRDELGDFKFADVAKVRFVFEGDATTGRLGVVGKDGKVRGRLRIIKEGAAWKINER